MVPFNFEKQNNPNLTAKKKFTYSADKKIQSNLRVITCQVLDKESVYWLKCWTLHNVGQHFS